MFGKLLQHSFRIFILSAKSQARSSARVRRYGKMSKPTIYLTRKLNSAAMKRLEEQ